MSRARGLRGGGLQQPRQRRRKRLRRPAAACQAVESLSCRKQLPPKSILSVASGSASDWILETRPGPDEEHRQAAASQETGPAESCSSAERPGPHPRYLSPLLISQKLTTSRTKSRLLRLPLPLCGLSSLRVRQSLRASRLEPRTLRLYSVPSNRYRCDSAATL